MLLRADVDAMARMEEMLSLVFAGGTQSRCGRALRASVGATHGRQAWVLIRASAGAAQGSRGRCCRSGQAWVPLRASVGAHVTTSRCRCHQTKRGCPSGHMCTSEWVVNLKKTNVPAGTCHTRASKIIAKTHQPELRTSAIRKRTGNRQ